MEYAGVWVNFRKKNHRYIIKGVMQNTWGNSKGVTLRPTGGNPRDDPPNYVPVDFSKILYQTIGICTGGSSEAPGSYRYIIRGVLLRPTGDNPRDDPPNYVPVDFGGGARAQKGGQLGEGGLRMTPRIMYR